MLATVCLREFAILTLYDNVLTVAYKPMVVPS